MKIAVKQNGKIFLKDIEPRPLEPHEIRLAVQACGICGTDLHTRPGETDEVLIGHEVAGTITELGRSVSGLTEGQRIVLDSATPCGRCANCRNARQELCTDKQSFWFSRSFGLAEQMIAPAINAVGYDGLTPEVACLQEPLGVAIDMVRLADIRTDSNVLIMGLGPIGLMSLALVKRAGARRVYVSDYRHRTGRTRVAEQFGADAFIDPEETSLEAYDFGCGIDRILVSAPPQTLPSAFALAAEGAIISFIGIAFGGGERVTFDANAFHFKKLQLRASFASPALFGPLALQYLSEGVVDGKALISHVFPLDRTPEAVETARSDPEAVKVVVRP